MTGLVILLKLDSNLQFFSPCDVEIWWMTPKKDRAPLLYYIKLCASFQIHQWIKTGVTVLKHPIWVKIDDFFSRVTTSSMLLQALCIISKPLGNSNWSFSPETPNLRQNRQFFEPHDLAIWWMTFKNNRAPLLCYFKPCAAFHSHWWIQTGVTVRKCPIWVNLDDFFSHVTLKFDGWPWKTIGHLS